MAGIGPCGDPSPAAVRPLGKIVDAFICDDKNNKSEGKAGIYAAGDQEDELEDLDDDIEYVPREEPMEEGAGQQEESQNPGEGQEENEEEEIVICEPCGEVKPNTWTSPVRPTKAEVEDHELTHCPYMSWCSVCVEAMGREDPHVRQGPPEESALPVVGMDYDKYGEEEAVTDQVTSRTRAR